MHKFFSVDEIFLKKLCYLMPLPMPTRTIRFRCFQLWRRRKNFLNNLYFQITIHSKNTCVVDEMITVYMWGDRTFQLDIPIKFQIVTAVIDCIPKSLDINFCFCGYDYSRKLQLVNETNLHCTVTYTPVQVSSIHS